MGNTKLVNKLMTLKSGSVDKVEQKTLKPLSLSDRKRIFLQKYKSQNGKINYRRYIGSPLRYAGGKSLAVGLIIEHIPQNIKKIISPFFGGGSVEIACSKELNLRVIGYDVFDILMNYWDVQINQPEKLYKELLKFKPNRDTFKEIKERLKKHWKGEIKLGKLKLAAHYFFNHNTSYGPHFLGSPSDIYLEEERYKKIIEQVKNLNVKNMKVSALPFEETIPKHKNDFLYCDPPYYLGGDSKMFVGMYPHRNFPIHHKNFNHELLRDLLMKHKGGFILSYNDCSEIRKLYKGCNWITPKWQYTFGQGDTRLGVNRIKNNNGSHIKESHELLIWKL